jgi:acetyl-CoA C-acetyltransferase
MKPTTTVLNDDDVCILAYSRTPIGAFNGSLKSFPATQLGTIAIASALNNTNLNPSLVDAVYFGNVLSANLGQAPARQAALGAGIPSTTPCTTVQKVCASGMKSIALGAADIKLGHARCVVVGGMESMTRVPFYATTARFGHKLGNVTLMDGLNRDGLEDVYTKKSMGHCAEICASALHYTREMQDRYTYTSYQRAVRATKQGKFHQEIVPIEIPGEYGRPSRWMTEDEECTARSITPSSLAVMRTAGFEPPEGGTATVTAASSSTISDGAAALVLSSGAFAKQHKAKVIAVVSGWGDAAKEPTWFTTAPSEAIPIALTRAGVTIKDVDYFEINEAFSVVALANKDILKIDHDKLNVYGGAVSLGHPLGCSGARIVCTLLSVLLNEGGHVGCAGICNGGGGASAMVVKLYSTGETEKKQKMSRL